MIDKPVEAGDVDSGRTRLEEVARLLKRIRLREDSHSSETLQFPTAYERELLQTLAGASQSHVDQIEISSGDSVGSAYADEIWREVSESGIGFRRVIVLGHSGLLADELIRRIELDLASGISTRIVSAGSLSETEATRLSAQLTIDGVVAAISPVTGSYQGQSWTVTAGAAQVFELDSQFRSLWDSAYELSEIPETLSLEEPLVQSADLISSVAPVLCSGNHVDGSDCGWYHGTWQFLRLMDLVSTPTWHHDFYADSIRYAIAAGARNVLITGTADYSVLAYVLDAANDLGVDVTVTVVDLCQTPLFASQWYAKRVGTQVNTIAQDLLLFASETTQKYDVIVTDAFLTRFHGNLAYEVLRAWSGLLTPGGEVITTVRAHAASQVVQTTDEAIIGFRDRARARWRRWEPFIHRRRSEIAQRAEIYARNMVSNTIGGVDDVIALVSRDFDVRSSIIADVPGELFPTRYVRVNMVPKKAVAE